MIFSRWLNNKIADYHFLLAKRIAAEVALEMTRQMIAIIGIDELESIVKKANSNKEKSGHVDYQNLAKIYLEVLERRKLNPTN